MGLTRTVAPASEPVTLPELKGHLRIDDTAQDAELNILLQAARENVEHQQKRQLITATYAYTLDEFPSGAIFLPMPPFIAILGSGFQYIDTAGDTQTWAVANYQEDATGERGSVCPVPSASYPSTEADRKNAITITYTAGYGTSNSDVPETTRLAIMMLAAHWFENREPVAVGTIVAEFPMHIKNLIDAEALKFF